jgi:hypothetical protein
MESKALELLFALQANQKALDDDLELTYDNVIEVYKELQKAMNTFIVSQNKE